LRAVCRSLPPSSRALSLKRASGNRCDGRSRRQSATSRRPKRYAAGSGSHTFKNLEQIFILDNCSQRNWQRPQTWREGREPAGRGRAVLGCKSCLGDGSAQARCLVLSSSQHENSVQTQCAREGRCDPRREAAMIIGHGFEKYPTGRLLGSSIERRWPHLFAERRSHPPGDLLPYTPKHTEVALLLHGSSTLTRQAAGIRQRFAAVPGTVWLCPAGLREDLISSSQAIAEVLHIYLSASTFSALETNIGCKKITEASIRYEGGFRDPLIEQIAQVILSEMRMETSAGKLLIESLSASLAARLMHSYSNVQRKRTDSPIARRGLDYNRLQRVVEFIEEHLEDDITVESLASTACLSRFHFARAFKAATGKAPHQFISVKRLELAKWLLTEGRRSLTDIAVTCRFSSQANFSRAFNRETGMTPGQYRAMATWPTFISQFRQRAPAISSAAGGRDWEETRRAVPSRHLITHRV
jgi:AraC family transcriptional regulator